MYIHFVKTVLIAPSDHPRWETDLLAKLDDLPSPQAALVCIASAPRQDGSPSFATPPRARR